MIYLIRSFGPGNESILKIGYTRDENWEKRKSMYLSHNPYVEVIETILGGTEEDEKRLHYKFRHLKLDFLREWFQDSKEIIDYFTSTSLEVIQSLPPGILTNFIIKEYQNNISFEILWMIGSMIKEVEGRETIDVLKIQKYKELVIKNNLVSLDQVFEFLKSDPFFSSLSPHSIEDFIIPPKIKEYIKSVYNTVTRFDDRMKTFIKDVDSGTIDVSFIPYPFRCYYTLGPDTLRRVGYQRSKIIEIITQLTNSSSEGQLSGSSGNLGSEIYSYFKIGDRYSKSILKSTIGEIYKKLGITKKPKANDIEEWFEVKVIKITNPETKKRDMGFELINKLK